MNIKKPAFASSIMCNVLALLALWFSVGQTKLLAQTAAQDQKVDDDSTKCGNVGNGPTVTDPSATNLNVGDALGATKPADVNAAVLKELEQMRARIQELEARL